MISSTWKEATDVRLDAYSALYDRVQLYYVIILFIVNLALNKSASQSSTYGRRPASHAVDGNMDTNNAYCTHTNTETDPWWRVDLGSQVDVADVNILNRGDCCGDRLSNFTILVGMFNCSNIKFGQKYD